VNLLKAKQVADGWPKEGNFYIK